MSVLVMAPPGVAGSAWYRRLFDGTGLVRGQPGPGCKAIAVINDHSAAVVGLLRRARELSARHADLPVALVTVVDNPDIEALIRLLGTFPLSACLPTGQALAAIDAERLPVEVRVDAQAINFEYDA